MNRNSALHWFPPIQSAGLPVPNTVMVPYSHRDCLSLFENEDSVEFRRLVGACTSAAELIGWPVFIRTDLTSAKHSGPRAYQADNASVIGNVCFRTLEDTEMKTWLERDGAEAFMVREFLTLPAPFTAFHGLPISREWRIFANEHRVICEHPYWPLDSLEDHVDLGTFSPSWIAERLQEMHRSPEAMPDLQRMAVEAAKACGGSAWSVDFCQDDKGKWWLLDMATMQDSYHWPACSSTESKGESV